MVEDDMFGFRAQRIQLSGFSKSTGIEQLKYTAGSSGIITDDRKEMFGEKGLEEEGKSDSKATLAVSHSDESYPASFWLGCFLR